MYSAGKIRRFLAYNIETGKILYIGSTPKGKQLQVEHIAYLEGVNADHHTQMVDVKTGAIIEKNEFSDGVWNGDELTIPAPNGTDVMWQGNIYCVDDKKITITVNYPGKHLMILEHDAYKQKVFFAENPSRQSEV